MIYKKGARMIIIIIALITGCFSVAQPLPSLIIDTEGKTDYYYDTLNTLAQSCHFNCAYKNIYDMLEYPEINNNYKALFFFAHPTIITQQQHPLVQDIIHPVRTFIQQGNKLIVLLLPSHASIDQLASFFTAIKLPTPITARTIAQLYLHYIAHPSAQQAKIYGTSLINKSIEALHLPTIPHNLKAVTTLPKKQIVSPLSVSLYDKKSNTIIALIPSIDATFADVAENFHKNPHFITDRNILLNQLQELLWELNSLYTTHRLPANNKPLLPHCFTQQYQNTAQSFSAAWLEPKDYYLHENTTASHNAQQQAVHDGCHFIHNCGFNVLWFEVNPEWYFSPMALFKKDKEPVMNIMKKIGTLLKHDTQSSPHIFIGSDITSNFNGQKPMQCVYDLFGKEYPNVPTPFAIEQLWNQELLHPFKQCYQELHHDVPINGLFLDFEMYHAPQQASSYHDHMDFSAAAWKAYQEQYPQIPDFHTVQDRVHYLKTNKCFKQYFAALTQKARAIGIHIRTQLHALDPQLKVAVYAPTLPSSWFYRGIMSGLCDKQHPILTATFNTDFNRHKKWLAQQHIYATHGTALMMSKLENLDTNLIKTIAPYHDFIWYNRPSRQLYQHTENPSRNHWWQAEYSTIHNAELAPLIKQHHH